MYRKPAVIAAGAVVLLLAAAYLFRAQVAGHLIGQAISGTATIGQISELHWAGLTARDVRLANIDFDAAIGDITLVIDLPALLFGSRLSLEQVRVADADIHIAPAQPVPGTGDLPEKESAPPLIILHRFDVSETRVRYQDIDQDVLLQLASCRGEPAQKSVAWECNGSIQAEPVTAVGTYGLPDADSETEPFSISATWRDVSLEASGHMDHPLSLAHADLEFSVTAERGAGLLALMGIQEVRDGPVELTVRYRDDGSVTSVNANGFAGGMHLSANASAENLAALQEAEIMFEAAGPSLFEAGALADYLRFEDVPFAASGSVTRRRDTGLTVRDLHLSLANGEVEASLVMPAFPATENMNLELHGRDMSPTLLQPLSGTCELPREALAWQGSIRVDGAGTERVNISVTGPEHQLEISGTLNTGNIDGAVDIAVNAEGFTFQAIGRCFNLDLPGVKTSISTEFAWQSGLLTFRRIALDSSIFTATGRVTVEPSQSVPFDVALALKTPDARVLAGSLLADPGPLNSFPLSGQLSVRGDRQDIPAFSFIFTAAGHDGSISGRLGKPATLDGLDLNMSLAGDNLRTLLADPQQNTDTPQPFSVKTRVRHGRDHWEFSDIDLHIVRTDISGSARLTTRDLLAGSSVQLTGTGGNLENLLGPWVDLPVPNIPFEIGISATHNDEGIHVEELRLTAGDHALDAELVIDHPPDFSRSSGSVRLRGPSTVDLFSILGISTKVLDRPYDASLQIEGDAESLFIRDLSLTAGETDLHGSLRYSGTQPPAVQATLTSGQLYLPLLSPGLLEKSQREEKRKFMFSDNPLPVGLLGKLNGQLVYTAKKVWVNPEYETGVHADLLIQDGGISTRAFQWEGVHAEGTMQASLVPDGETYRMTLSARSDRLPIIWLLAGESEPSTGTSFHIDVTGNGSTPRALMASMNGTILFKGGGGLIKGNALNLFFGDFMQSIASNITENRDPRTRIACTAGAFNIRDGLARISPGFVARTDKVDVFTTGSVNLGSESPDLTIFTKSRTGIGLSAAKVVAPRLKVKGTLTEPRFQVDTTGTAINTWLALSSGGMSLIASGLWDRMTSAGDACDSLYQEARKLPAYASYLEE